MVWVKLGSSLALTQDERFDSGEAVPRMIGVGSIVIVEGIGTYYAVALPLRPQDGFDTLCSAKWTRSR